MFEKRKIRNGHVACRDFDVVDICARSPCLTPRLVQRLVFRDLQKVRKRVLLIVDFRNRVQKSDVRFLHCVLDKIAVLQYAAYHVIHRRPCQIVNLVKILGFALFKLSDSARYLFFQHDSTLYTDYLLKISNFFQNNLKNTNGDSEKPPHFCFLPFIRRYTSLLPTDG